MEYKKQEKLVKLTLLEKKLRALQDFYVGGDRVVNERYVVKNNNESYEKYAKRLEITPFVNVFSVILDAIVGIITKRTPVVDPSNSFDFFNFEDIDSFGNDLHTFYKKVCLKTLLYGCCFVTVESILGNNLYLKTYDYADLITYTLDGANISSITFAIRDEDSLWIMGRDNNKQITYHVGGGYYYDESNKTEWKNSLKIPPVVCIKAGKELSRFEIISKFFDTLNLNKTILNLESLLCGSYIRACSPTPVFYGDRINPNTSQGLVIDSNQALRLEDKQRQGFEYVEPRGNGLQLMESKIQKLYEDIDKISYSLLQKTDNRTVIDAIQNQSKNTSFVSDVASEHEDKFNKLMAFGAELAGKTPVKNARIILQKDFDDYLITDKQIELIKQSVNEGNLSRQTYWKKLKSIGILNEDFDPEKEEELIKNEVGEL